MKNTATTSAPATLVSSEGSSSILEASRAASRERLGKLLFLGAAFASFLLSVSLWFGGFREEGAFVGLWVPSILSLGTLTFVSRRKH